MSSLPKQTELVFALLPLLPIGVAVFLTYYALGSWFNRTHILTGHGQITVRHRPVPWRGDKDVEASDLRQLYAREKITKVRSQYVVSTFTNYEVRAETIRGRNIKIVEALETQEQAIFIEHKIEQYLRLADAPVRGEVQMRLT